MSCVYEDRSHFFIGNVLRNVYIRESLMIKSMFLINDELDGTIERPCPCALLKEPYNFLDYSDFFIISTISVHKGEP